MGYTHYYYTKPKLDAKKFKFFAEGVKKILAKDVDNFYLAYEFNQINKLPQVDSRTVRFNGKGEDGHETFMLTRNSEVPDYQRVDRNMAFSFCKTARKPYDIFVVACLVWAKMVFGEDIRISSDGGLADWEAGRKLAVEALELKDNVILEDAGEFGFTVKAETKVEEV